MKKKLLAIVATGLLSGSMAANATLLFSDVQVTANSVSFTVDGDMTGYAAAPFSYEDQFSLVFLGDVWAGTNGFSANTWSTSVFDNKSMSHVGNTGGFGLANNYAWSAYTSDLSNAYASNRHVTLTTANYFNPLANAGEIRFVLGNGGANSDHTVLGSVQVTNTSVPEPSTLALLGIGLAGIGLMRRRSI